MEAGRLTEIIKFEKPVVVKDEYGSSQVEWQEVFTTKANVIYTSGQKTIDNYEIFHSYVKTFEIRMYHNINEKMRIVYKGNKYDILSIEHDKPYQKIIIITQLVNE